MNQAFHFILFLFCFSHLWCYSVYDFTYVCLVIVNNALELANQREYYIGLKHKPSDMINLECVYMMFLWQRTTGQCFLLLIYYFKPSCHTDSGTLILGPESPLFSTILNREAHPILTNICVCMALAVLYMKQFLQGCFNNCYLNWFPLTAVLLSVNLMKGFEALFFMVAGDKYTRVCIHNLMMVKVVNCPITGKEKKFRISLLSAHLL